MSVIEIVRINCQKGKGDEFVERLKRGLSVQGKDPNCTEIFFQRQVEDPLDGSRVDSHAGGAKAAVEQDLRERAAERVPHDDRRAVERPDDAVVVVDDLFDVKLCDPGRVAAQLVDVAVHAGPGRRDDVVAAALVTLDPVLPAERRHPESVDQDDVG